MIIVIVDYGIGNVQSILNALKQFEDVDVVITDDQTIILNADGLILPGVGAYKKAMEELEKRNLPAILKTYYSQRKPLLGICLGMQLLFESSDEFGHSKGLGLVKGHVNHFPHFTKDKLPHVSWNSIKKKEQGWNGTIFHNIKNNDFFYFVHSYICKPEDEDIVISTTEYGGIEFCSSIQQDSIYACQFHPEKSSTSGLNVMENFINIVRTNK